MKTLESEMWKMERRKKKDLKIKSENREKEVGCGK